MHSIYISLIQDFGRARVFTPVFAQPSLIQILHSLINSYPVKDCITVWTSMEENVQRKKWLEEILALSGGSGIKFDLASHPSMKSPTRRWMWSWLESWCELYFKMQSEPSEKSKDIVLYTTSLGIIRLTKARCATVKRILSNLMCKWVKG